MAGTRGKLKPQGKMSDSRYLKYKTDRIRALEKAQGKASDELAQEIADKYGGVGDWKDSLGRFCEESFGEFIRKD